MERISDPGQITSMIGYLSQPDDYSTSSGLKSCWSKDTTNNANSSKYSRLPNANIPANAAIDAGTLTPLDNPNYNQGFASRKGLLMSSDPIGNFSFVIPFDHIFGFGEYTKVMYGQKHSLSLTRMTSDNLAIHRAAGVQDGKITLNYIAWKVPIVKPSKAALNLLDNIIFNKEYLPVAYSARNSERKNVTQTRTFDWTLNVTAGIEKPRWIIVGFQTNKDQTQEQNPAVFDHVNLERTHVNLGSDKYPTSDIITNFPINDYSELYEMFDNFKKEYYSFNSLVGGTQVNFPAFKSLYPLIVFDVRRQSESLQSKVIDVTLKFFFREPVPANTIAYATIISNKMGKFGSDGKNLYMIIN
jgi:hypothetical protein